MGGKPFTENPLRTFLQNRLFLGEVHHKGKYYPGQHQPIITQAQFDAVQAIFAENSKGKRKRTFQAKSKALLKGILVCGGCGGAMSPPTQKRARRITIIIRRIPIAVNLASFALLIESLLVKSKKSSKARFKAFLLSRK